jgi:Lrp/AsnC family transcriptional regulator, leucine-responsive regulatory protein
MSTKASLDDIDITILEILQRNGRTRRNELAEHVGLSLPSVSERLRKLEEQKLITGYHATVDYKTLGYDITAFIVVTVDSSRHYGQFLEHAQAQEEILECHAVTGEGTHMLKVRTANTASLERLLARIQAWAGVVGTRTNLVLSTRKETQRVRIPTQHQSPSRG